MLEIFGTHLELMDAQRLVPDITRVAGIRHFREENGPGAGQRIMRIETGGGLSVELLPDRTCDIGQVWCNGVPFGWAGPIGVADVTRLRGNQPLSGLMTTCGFDHIRQPDTVRGVPFPLHGSMMHQSATILAAEPVWKDDKCVFRVVSETVQFSLGSGGMRLRRVIEIPLGGTSVALADEVTVFGEAQPIMAMYHFNLGYPISDDASRLELNGADIGEQIKDDGVRTRPAGQGEAISTLTSSDGRATFSLNFDARQLPVFQTLRNSMPGVNLICIEPASHDRVPRADLERAGMLKPVAVGENRNFNLVMNFMSSR